MSQKRRNNQNIKVFFERQRSSNTCRLHVINDALGRAAISKKKFFEYCDEFDLLKHCKGSRMFFFVDSEDNIISFILNKYKIRSSYHPPDDPPHIDEHSCHNIIAVMNFDHEHIWCTRKYKDTWFKIDSLSDGPIPVPFRSIFSKRGYGWIIVWKNSEPTLDQQTCDADLNVVQSPRVNEENAKERDQVITFIRKRRSKYRNLDADIISDEPTDIINVDNSTSSNRFDILTDVEEEYQVKYNIYV